MYANLSDEKAFVFSVALAEINRKIINQRLILWLSRWLGYIQWHWSQVTDFGYLVASWTVNPLLSLSGEGGNFLVEILLQMLFLEAHRLLLLVQLSAEKQSVSTCLWWKEKKYPLNSAKTASSRTHAVRNCFFPPSGFAAQNAIS